MALFLFYKVYPKCTIQQKVFFRHIRHFLVTALFSGRLGDDGGVVTVTDK